MQGFKEQDTSRPAIIDIGSNSVRLVVFNRKSRAFLPIFNEKSLPGLGRGLHKTGHLNPEGRERACKAICRFCHIAKALNVSDLTLLATAATRDASDGNDFVADIERMTGQPVIVLSGKEEARYSASGVIAGIPNADGIAADLGGGSLELAAISKGRVNHHATFPLGPLRLIDRAGSDLTQAKHIIDEELTRLDWLNTVGNGDLYPVGGIWRTLAKIQMAYAHYPLHILHEYRLNRQAMGRMTDLLGHTGQKSLNAIVNINKRRVEALPYGSLVMDRLLHFIQPRNIVYSANGLREGYLFCRLDENERKQDPLLVGCAELAVSSNRFPATADDLMKWLTPLFDPGDHRLLMAACLLSDFAWREHPDYRAEHAFLQILRAPVIGISHLERSVLALALAARYGAAQDEHYFHPAVFLLDEPMVRRAEQIGYGVRLAHTLCAGTGSVLEHTSIRQNGDQLILEISSDRAHLYGEAVEKRLKALARARSATTNIIWR